MGASVELGYCKGYGRRRRETTDSSRPLATFTIDNSELLL